MTWASDKGIAWDGANRTVLYFLVYALFVSLPWRRESIPLLLVGFSLAVLGIGLVALARSANNPTAYFKKGRFSAPAGYPNAACALYLLAFWPVAYTAVRRELPVVIRGLLLAAAVALAELALLCQSRGSLVAVPIAVVAYLVVVPQRLRAALGLAVVALAVLSVQGRLLDVFAPIRDGRDPRGVVHDALAAIGISCAGAVAVWLIVSALDRRVGVRPAHDQDGKRCRAGGGGCGPGCGASLSPRPRETASTGPGTTSRRATRRRPAVRISRSAWAATATTSGEWL